MTNSKQIKHNNKDLKSKRSSKISAIFTATKYRKILTINNDHNINDNNINNNHDTESNK